MVTDHLRAVRRNSPSWKQPLLRTSGCAKQPGNLSTIPLSKRWRWNLHKRGESARYTKPHLPLFQADPLHFRTSQDKFKASSGWVENFKHRHDLRKGGSWDRASNAAVWANSAAKYGVPGSTAADAAAANGQLGAPVPMSDEHTGGVDGGYGVAYSVGSDGYVHSANAVGSEV